ncbi:NAD-P-binding protein [Clavulina sp. PMI_390]|nr:NAD-P-binding protein [Clavulina sp. PMI_390]
MSGQKPHVLLLGGIPSCSQAIVNYLAPAGKESLVSYLRVVDKYLVDPPTTYVGGRAQAAFKQPHVEYMQGNLVYADRVEEAFTPPAGHPPFDIVIDCTGEVRIHRNDDVYFETSAALTQQCGREAVRAGIKAYVRLTHPFYLFPPTLEEGAPLGPIPDPENPGGLVDVAEPDAARGYWWHESLRALAAIEELPLVIIRAGGTYGPQQIWGSMYSRIMSARVYQYTEEEMQYWWAPNTQINSVHTEDMSRALWASALWMIQHGRTECTKLAGVRLKHFESDIDGDGYTEEKVKGLLDPAASVVAPFFDLVDDGSTTYESLGMSIAEAFELQFSFLNEEEEHAFTADLPQSAQDVNQMHMETWQELIANSDPPVPRTPLSPFVDLHKFERRPVALKNDRIKNILGLQLVHPKFDAKEVGDIIDAFIEEGTWPE